MSAHQSNPWSLQVGDRSQVNSGPSLGVALPWHWHIILVMLPSAAFSLPAGEISWDAGLLRADSAQQDYQGCTVPACRVIALLAWAGQVVAWFGHSLQLPWEV